MTTNCIKCGADIEIGDSCYIDSDGNFYCEDCAYGRNVPGLLYGVVCGEDFE